LNRAGLPKARHISLERIEASLYARDVLQLSLGANGSIYVTRTAAHATQGAAVAAAVDAASATAINSDDDREGLLMVTQARLGSCLTTDAAERARAALDKLGIAIITHSDSSNSTGVAMVIVSSSDLEVRVSIVSLRPR
jgi:hypothetical protein